MTEIEKTFVVNNPPKNLEQYCHEEIQQGYFFRSAEPLRIRKKGKKFEMTKKFPSSESFSTQEEITILLNEEEFNLFWPLTKFRLEKTRYFIPLEGGLTCELDVFVGDLEGLIVAEVEFESTEQMKNFVVPKWFGKDVTEQSETGNAFLAGKKYEEVRKYFSLNLTIRYLSTSGRLLLLVLIKLSTNQIISPPEIISGSQGLGGKPGSTIV